MLMNGKFIGIGLASVVAVSSFATGVMADDTSGKEDKVVDAEKIKDNATSNESKEEKTEDDVGVDMTDIEDTAGHIEKDVSIEATEIEDTATSTDTGNGWTEIEDNASPIEKEDEKDSVDWTEIEDNATTSKDWTEIEDTATTNKDEDDSKNEGVYQNRDVNVSINSGTMGDGGLQLYASPVNDFGQINLTPTEETHYTSFENDFTVMDIRGTQEGWSLYVTATPFRSSEHTLPSGSLTLDGVQDINRVGKGKGGSPSKELSSTAIIDNGSVLIANAEEGSGMGVHTVTFGEDSLGLTVDATTAKVGDYTSDLTWKLQATPSGE